MSAQWPRERLPLAAGPRILFTTLFVAAVIAGFSARVPALRISSHRPPVAHVVGWLLVALAVFIWVTMITMVRVAWDRGTLITAGAFAVVRHPIYSGFIFLACSGIALLSWDWPMMALPFVAYAAYRLFIRSEETQLAAEFGAAYEAYRREVPALVPRLRRKNGA